MEIHLLIQVAFRCETDSIKHSPILFNPVPYKITVITTFIFK